MRKIIVGAFVSLDGVMQAPGGPEEDPTGGFTFGGWTVPYWDDPEAGEVMSGMFGKPFDLLLGRKTYDIFAAHWPYQADEIASLFNPTTKFVATHRPDSLKWQNSKALGADVVCSLRALKNTDGPDLLTQGSSELLHLLFANNLVDEMNLLIFPVVLGKGKRLFDGKSAPGALKVVSSKMLGNGVINARYTCAGEVVIGNFQMAEPSAEEIERRKNMS